MAQSYPELTAAVDTMQGAAVSAIAALNGVGAKITAAVDAAMADSTLTKAELAEAVKAEVADLDAAATELGAAVATNP